MGKFFRNLGIRITRFICGIAVAITMTLVLAFAIIILVPFSLIAVPTIALFAPLDWFDPKNDVQTVAPDVIID